MGGIKVSVGVKVGNAVGMPGVSGVSVAVIWIVGDGVGDVSGLRITVMMPAK